MLFFKLRTMQMGVSDIFSLCSDDCLECSNICYILVTLIENTVISRNFMVWKFCRRHSFHISKSGEITVFCAVLNDGHRSESANSKTQQKFFSKPVVMAQSRLFENQGFSSLFISFY